MKRAFWWGIRLLGTRTLLILALLLVTMSAVSQGIAGLVRALDSTLLFITVVVGTLVAWALAKSRLSGRVAAIVILLSGTVIIVVQVGQLGGRLVALYQALSHLERQALYETFRTELDWSPVVALLTELWEGLATLAVRVGVWLQAVADGKPAFDPVAAAIVWSLGLWGISTWAAWGIRRQQQALKALLPALAFLAGTYAYTGAEAHLLIWPLSVLLVLMVVVGHSARERRWEAAGIDYSEDLRFDMALVVTPICVLLVAAAFIVPSVSIQDIVNMTQQAIAEPARQVQPLPDSLGLKPAPRPVASAVDALRAPGLPRSHLIGSGPELSHDIVMLVSTGDLPPMPQVSGIPIEAPPRYYWRSSTYDRYIGTGWVTGDTRLVEYQAGSGVISTTMQAQKTVRQAVRLNANLGALIYRAGTLVAADRQYRVAWRTNDDMFDARFNDGSVDVYRADSSISTATEEQLRRVMGDYPDWIRERYLQLPKETPERVLSLARDLTAIKPTPYDRAVAIESYLRAYSYTLDLPAPPPGRDVTDYFLFDIKRGYCDYFATSMVVLARAAGLPARLVVGYASGSYDPMNANYIVTRADAHSWPEIYFNEYGWVEFEPTSGRAAIDRPSTSRQVDVTTKLLEPLQPYRTWFDQWRELISLGALALVILAVPAWLLFDTWRLQRLSPRAVVSLLYRRLYAGGGRLAVPSRPGDTPFEYTSSLVGRVTEVAPEVQRDRVQAAATHEFGRITDVYVRMSYSTYQPDDIDRWQALQGWRHARSQLWLAWLWQLAKHLRIPRRREAKT